MTKNRIQILKEKMLSQPRYVSIEQALIITKTYKQHENERNLIDMCTFKNINN